MWNILLETGGKAIFVIQWQKFSLIVPYSYVENRIYKQWIWIVELISKQIVEEAVWFLLAAYSKIWKERDKRKEELLRKEEPGFDDWGNSQPVQIAKGAKIRIVKARKVCSAEKANGVTRQPFASTEEIRHVTHGSLNLQSRSQEYRWD